MNLKLETIVRVLRAALALCATIAKLPLDMVKPAISSGNSKIGRVLNVSKLPGVTCKNCKQCLKYCYAVHNLVRRGYVVMYAWARNTVLMQTPAGRDKLFNAVNEKMQRRRAHLYYRHDVSGELIDMDELKRLVKLATDNPRFTLWTYTKMHALVNLYVAQNGGTRAAAIPANLHIMFSEWDGMPTINPYGFPVFSVKLKAGNIDHDAAYFDRLYKCPGNCDLCKAETSADGKRHGCILGENTYADEH